MNLNNLPIDHHYIPQFLLSAWTVDGFLYRFEKPIPGKVVDHRRPTRAVGYKKRLYEIPEYPPEKAQSLETGFMRLLDTKAAQVHKDLISRNPDAIDVSARSIWATFLMSLMLRTPDNLASYKAGFTALFNAPSPEVQAEYEAKKQDSDPDTAEEYLAINNPQSPVTAAFEQLPFQIQNRPLGRFIVNMLWFVVEVKRGSFLLSDEPLITSNGLGKSDGHLVMPISPKLLFVAAGNKETAQTLREIPEKELVCTANEKIVERAAYFVVADDLSQKRFIQNRFGRKPESSVAKLFAEKYAAPSQGA